MLAPKMPKAKTSKPAKRKAAPHLIIYFPSEAERKRVLDAANRAEERAGYPVSVSAWCKAQVMRGVEEMEGPAKK